MAENLLDKIGVKAGEPITPEGLEELKKAWMQVYLVFHLLMSPTNLVLREKLDEIKLKLSEANELIMPLELT